jgi:hypothetical protein
MSLNIHRGQPVDDGLLVQDGRLILRGQAPRTVYYPIPYASTPNLNFLDAEADDDEEENWFIVEQQWDHFTVQPTESADSAIELTWTAKGQRGPPAFLTTPMSGPPASTPTTTLPAMPIPVDPSGK